MDGAESLRPPDGAWMHKARSQKESGGFFRGIGSSAWNRRFVWVEGNAVCYGKSKGSKEKVIAFEALRSAARVPPKTLSASGAPSDLCEFGWQLRIADKDIVWACESREAQQQWVNFVSELLVRLRDGGNERDGADDAAAMTTITTMAKLGVAPQSQARFGAPLPPDDDEDLRSAAGGAGGGDDDDGDGGDGGALVHRSQRELKQLTGAAADDEDDLSLDAALAATDADDFLGDDFDELSDLDDDDDDASEGGSGVGGAGKGGRIVESQEQLYARLLLPVAERPHNHIAFKLEQYRDLFKKDDGPNNVVFSRSVHKVAKRDNIQERDVLITHKYVYFVAQGRFTAHKTRIIDIDQLVGIIESADEPTLFALIIPSFHDVLLRIIPQNSLVGGSEVEVKRQLIAHLYRAHREHVSNRQFIFREAVDIRAVIRRCEDDQHLPLVESEHRLDRLQAATNKYLYPVFRTNAESFVYFSTMVLRVNPSKEQRPKGFVITDAACYFTSDARDKVSRRIPLVDIVKIFYDINTSMLLAKCADYDFLVVARSQEDFNAMKTLIPSSAALSRHTIKTQASNQLYSHAQLVEVKKLADQLGAGFANTEEGLKRAMAMTQRLLRMGVKVTSTAAGKAGKQVVSLGLKSKDLLSDVGKGASALVMDNAVAGEMFGLMGAAGNMLIARSRYVLETCLTMKDEEQQRRVDSATNDTLGIAANPSAAALKLGVVYHSSRCQKFNLLSQVDVDKTVDRYIVVCDLGVVLLHDPLNSSGLTARAARLLRSARGLEIDERLEWKLLRAVLRCERNIIGLQLTDDRGTDWMMRVPNSMQTDKLVSHMARLFHQLNSRPHCSVPLPIFRADRLEQLRIVLRKTTFDPYPTIALRGHPVGDVLKFATEPEIAEMCRKHGDNAVFFSGLAWRFRGKATKEADKMGNVLSHIDEHKEDKKNFKSFQLLLTNCAVYQLTKGNNEVVRRVEIMSIVKVRTSVNDPDAILLVIDGANEFDMLFRVEGRAKEFLERLQEAYLGWTEFGLRRPSGASNVHDASKLLPPVERVANLLANAERLVKPQGYNEVQANRQAIDVHRKYQAFFHASITRALEERERALADLRRLTDSADAMSDRFSEGGTVLPKRFPFAKYAARVDDVVASVEFHLSRAYKFGFRPAGGAFPLSAMVAATKVLAEWSSAKKHAAEMIAALESEDVDAYELLAAEAEHIEGLQLLVDEQLLRHRNLKEKQSVVRGITRLIHSRKGPAAAAVKDADENSNDDDDYIDDHLPELVELFRKARRMQVRSDVLERLRVDLDRRLQAERLTTYLGKLRHSSTKDRLDPATREVLLAACERLEVSGTVRASIISAEDPQVQWATRVLDAAVATGMAGNITEAVERVEQSEVASQASAKLDEARAALRALHDAEPELNELHEVVRILKAAVHRLALDELEEMLPTLERVAAATSNTTCSSASLAPHHEMAKMYIERVQSAMAARRDEMRAQDRIECARQAMSDRIRAREEEEAELQRAAEHAAELQEKQRRMEQVAAWQQRGSKMSYSMKQFVATQEVDTVRNLLRSCNTLLQEIQTAFAQFPAEEAEVLASQYENAAATLKSTQSLGRSLLETFEARRTNRATQAAARIPEEVLSMIQENNQPQLIAYIHAHQGSMPLGVIEEIRRRWQDAASERAWVAQLHQGLHTAVALKNTQLIRNQLQAARAKGYRDAVTNDATAILEAMLQAEGEKGHGDDAAHVGVRSGDAYVDGVSPPASCAGGPPREQPQSSPQPPALTVPQLKQQYSASQGARGAVMGALIRAIAAMLASTADNAPGSEDRALLRVPEDSQPVREVVGACMQVLQHRARPTGIFKKVERTMIDVLTVAGNITRNGTFLAPRINRLLSDFDRIKRFNNPHGHSSGYVMMTYVLAKGDLPAIVSEMAALPAKDLENLFFEDGVFRSSTCCDDLLTIAEFMSGVEWSFSVRERVTANVEVMKTPAPMPTAQLAAIKSASPHAWLLAPDAPAALLRRSTAAISSYFAEQLKSLGARPSTDAIRRIFDESAHKAVGILVRENLCVAISAIFRAGFKPTHFLSKRYVWMLLCESGEKLRESARDLGGVALPDVIDMVHSLTDKDGRQRSVINRLSEDQLMDVRFRMFVCHALNQRSLAAFVEAIFDDSSANQKLLDKFYAMQSNPMIAHAESREEILKLLQTLSQLPFVLCLDAEIW